VVVPASGWRASAPSFAVPGNVSANADGDGDGGGGGDGDDGARSAMMACLGHWRQSSHRCPCIPVRPLEESVKRIRH